MKSDNPARKLGKFLSRLFILSLLVSSCTDDDVTGSGNVPLQVSVTANSPMVSRAIVTDEYLPDGSTIGVTVTDADGNSYDNQNYFNVKYTASGTGDVQTWTGAAEVSLSTTVGKAVAYYPWQEVADLTAIPVETDSQTDYMYSKPVTGLSLASPAASFTMNHVLTDIRVKVIRGDYTGEGALESVSVKSSAFATGATLNVHDGSLASVSGKGTEFKSEYTDKTITAEGLVQDYLVVPVVSVTSGDVSVNVNIDGKKFTAPVQFTEAFIQGFTYYFDLTLNNKELTLNKVKVEPWAVEMQTNDNLEFYDDQYIVEIQVPNDGYTYKHNINVCDVEIDWGDDNTVEHFTNNKSASSNAGHNHPTHTYEKAGTYIVTTSGQISELSSYLASTIISKIIHIGKDVNVKKMRESFESQKLLKEINSNALDGCLNVWTFEEAFAGCTSLQNIPEGLFDKCTEVTTFNKTFQGCTSLTVIPKYMFGSKTKTTNFEGVFQYCSNLQTISSDLFDECTKVTNFKGAFAGCDALQTIPAGLFDHCTEVITFERTFENCDNLQAIPEGLFDNSTKITSFYYTFGSCTAVQAIPAGLFDHCTEVISFTSTFVHCSNLKEIPQGLFDKCTEVTDFGNTFNGCTSLKTIPEGLFDHCTEVTSFYGTFGWCKNLQTIPAGLFDYNTKVTTFYSTFLKCESLQTIPEGLFDACTEVTTFSRCFWDCKELQSIPEGLFDYNTKVTEFEITFAGCTALTTIPEGMFDHCTEVTSFDGTFRGMDVHNVSRDMKIKSIPVGLFDYNTKVKDFGYAFCGCSALTSIPEGLFDKCTEVTKFSYTFSGCTSLGGIPAGLFDNNTKVTDFAYAFYKCESLTEIPEGLFDYNPLVKSFSAIFYACKGLTNIPSKLFDACTEVTNFSSTFEGTGITSIPEGLFDKCPEVTSFWATFAECRSLESIPVNIFDNNRKVTSFGGYSSTYSRYGTFYNCTKATGESPYTVIQVDGVDTKVHLYERANYPEYFTNPKDMYCCFGLCTKLSDYSTIPSGWK